MHLSRKGSHFLKVEKKTPYSARCRRFRRDSGISSTPRYRKRPSGIYLENFCVRNKTYNSLSSKAGSPSCRCTTYVGGRTKMKRHANKTGLVLHSFPETSHQVEGHFSIMKVVWELDQQTNGKVELHSGNDDARIR